MEDVLHLVGQALTIFAIWLDHISSPLPWPLVVGMLFLPLVLVLRVMMWILRGRVWPVPCMYYHTQQRRADKPCRMLVPGEWKYCRHHKQARRMSDGHQCDPTIRRWQERGKTGGLQERTDIRGVGFVRLLSNRQTLLFYKGIARRPGDVFRDMPQLPGEFWRGVLALRQLSFRTLFRPSTGAPTGVAVRMPYVVRATRFTLLGFGIGLILVIVSVLLEGGWRATVQYSGTAAFAFAWNSLRFGVWKDASEQPRWFRTVVVDTGKGMTFIVALALAAVTVNALGNFATTYHVPPTPKPTTQVSPSGPRR